MIARKPSILEAELIAAPVNSVFDAPNFIGWLEQSLIVASDSFINKNEVMLFFKLKDLDNMVLLKFGDLGCMIIL